MRCECCNKLLSTREATRRFHGSGEFVDMCDECLETISDQVEVTKGNTSEKDIYDEED